MAKFSFGNLISGAVKAADKAMKSAAKERDKQAKVPLGDICDSLVGKYPKNFKWSGFHEGCICYTTSILCTKPEMREYFTTGIMKSENEVKDMPEAFYDWMELTNYKLEKFDFIKNNQKLINKRNV